MTHASKSVQEFCTAHRTSRPTFYRMLAAGKIEALKIGRRTIVSAEAEAAWLASLPKAGSAKAVR